MRAAAEANGETLTGFLLTAGAERAAEVLERAGRIAVSEETFERFAAALDADAQPMPTLSRYSSEEPGAPGRIRTCAPGSGGRCSIP